MSVYLRAKFQVSSITLTSFRRGGGGVILPLTPTQNEPSKSPLRLGFRENKELPFGNRDFLLSICTQISLPKICEIYLQLYLLLVRQ